MTWISFTLYLESPGFAGIKSAPSTSAENVTSGPSAAGSLPEIEDIAPPLDVLPYPSWLLGLCALLLVAGLFSLARVWMRRRPVPVPADPPRVQALRALEKLGAQIETLSPYALSIGVSDVVRQFVEAETGVLAVRQTSVEFLASISQRLSASERDQMAQFLERCDLIKFAQAAASTADSRNLLSSAETFIQGQIQ